MCPPTGSPLKSKLMSMYLPKRLELWLRLVRAFPKASSTQVDLSNTSLTLQEGTGWGYNVKTSSRGPSSSPVSQSEPCSELPFTGRGQPFTLRRPERPCQAPPACPQPAAACREVLSPDAPPSTSGCRESSCQPHAQQHLSPKPHVTPCPQEEQVSTQEAGEQQAGPDFRFPA